MQSVISENSSVLVDLGFGGFGLWWIRALVDAGSQVPTIYVEAPSFRHEMINWVNKLLQSQIRKVKEIGTNIKRNIKGQMLKRNIKGQISKEI